MIILEEAQNEHGQKEPQVLAVVMKQTVTGSQPLRKFVKTVDYIEEKTGLDFFHELNDSVENALEASAPAESWEVHQMLTK